MMKKKLKNNSKPLQPFGQLPQGSTKLRIALIVPHIFMQNGFEEHLIFAPGKLAIDLALGLTKLGVEVHFFTPDLQIPEVKNYNIDLDSFYKIAREKIKPSVAINKISSPKDPSDYKEGSQSEKLELLQEFLKKHPLTCITLSRQILTELISKVYKLGNNGEFDLIHFFTAEEEIAQAFAKLSKIPVCFTHHEPFNFLAKYQSQFERYKNLNWISISHSQQKSLQEGNFIANVYNGFDNEFDYEYFENNLSAFSHSPSRRDNLQSGQLPNRKYEKDTDLLYIGRIIKPKGVKLAVRLAEKYNLKLKIIGKYYSGFGNDNYFEEEIKPHLNSSIEYLGYISDLKTKSELIFNSKCVIMPSIWDEPFGMVQIESMSVGTPILGLDSGSIPEITIPQVSGIIVEKQMQDPFHIDEEAIVDRLYEGFQKVIEIPSEKVFEYYKQNFTMEKMVRGYLEVYEGFVQR